MRTIKRIPVMLLLLTMVFGLLTPGAWASAAESPAPQAEDDSPAEQTGLDGGLGGAGLSHALCAGECGRKLRKLCPA